MARDEPNQFPQLVTPTEGRGWADVFGGFEFAFPDMGLWKKLLPLIFFTLLCLVITAAGQLGGRPVRLSFQTITSLIDFRRYQFI